MRTRNAVIAASLAALLSAGSLAFAQYPSLQAVVTYMGEAATFKQTYSGSAYAVPASTPTDICTLTGSATKTIRVRRIQLSGIATAVGSFPIAIVKRSAANTGNFLAVTEVPYDSQNAAATAVMAVYSSNPSALGTAVGVLADPLITFNNATTGISGNTLTELRFGQLGNSITLRGVAQTLAVNGNDATIAGGLLSCMFEWTEE